VREDVVQTAHGPVATTVTIGGRGAAPRPQSTDPAHAQNRSIGQARRRGSYVAYRPNIEREAVRMKTSAPPTNHHRTERAAHLPAFSRSSDGITQDRVL
jgi:hypothetical protein